MQECYCRLAQLSDISHIAAPRAYLFTMARNLAEQQRKRARVVRIEAMADADDVQQASDPLSPDRFATAREELARVQAALATLSDRARRIFIMRKVEGLSQREIAQALGVSETIVENEASRSLRAVLKLLTEDEDEAGQGAVMGGVSRARSR